MGSEQAKDKKIDKINSRIPDVSVQNENKPIAPRNKVITSVIGSGVTIQSTKLPMQPELI